MAPLLTKKVYHRADVLYGKCTDQEASLDAVKFFGIKNTKSDALIAEIAHLYTVRQLTDLIRDCNLAAKHMQEVGLFNQVIPMIDLADGKSGQYVVNFVVKEPKAFTLGVKAGVTTRGDADYSLSAGRQNLGGRGEAFNSSFAYTVKGDQAFNISLSKPILGWQKYSNFLIGLYRSQAHLLWNTSDVTESGMLFQYNGELWQRKLHHTIRLNAIWRKFCPTNDAIFAIREYAGHTVKCSLENSIAYDTRDRSILPTKGALLKFAQEYCGLIGDAAFLKHQINLQAASSLFLDAFLSASVQLSLLNSLAERTIHPLDRLYLGGAHDVRGFIKNCLGTRASTPCLGGSASLVGVLHIYKPLFPPEMLYAHIFLASGSVASMKSTQRFRDLLEQSRLSIGCGLTFVFRNLIRFEMNYVLPIMYKHLDACSSGLQFGAGIDFL